MSIRVLVVDDSAFMRRAIREMLMAEQDLDVIGLAKNGIEAIDMARRLKPDVVSLDIEMPQMDGLTALRRIMREAPTQVLMCSSLTTKGSLASLQALRMGAADVIAKEQSQITLNVDAMRDDLLMRIRALGKNKRPTGCAKSVGDDELPKFRHGQFDAVCIGSSTGGPPVLETILAALPAGFDTPIIIAQHMPNVFTQSMAQRLDGLTHMQVILAEDNMPIARGRVYIAPGGLHTKVRKIRLARWSLEVNKEPSEAVYKPSVSALFDSAAEAMGKRAMGIVLTGIGDDGRTGAIKMHEAGAPVIAQSQETCVVYGMPRAVTMAAVTTASLGPKDIGRSLSTMTVKAAA